MESGNSTESCSIDSMMDTVFPLSSGEKIKNDIK